jgi:hypothetical protein
VTEFLLRNDLFLTALTIMVSGLISFHLSARDPEYHVWSLGNFGAINPALFSSYEGIPYATNAIP